MNKPSLTDLGTDLLRLTKFQLVLTLALPFLFFTLYFVFAFNALWIPAVLCTMALSFFSYGSTSHDLVHENLHLNKTLNAVLLTTLELICFRSGHAYKLSHLHHHKRFPHDDDIEGSAAKMSFLRSLVEGMIFQFKLYFWALGETKTTRYKRLVVLEGLAVLILVVLIFYSTRYTNVYIVYFALMIAGSWIIPLVTSYAVHTPEGYTELRQTRLFRGRFFSMISFDHLYHLEHHLYPMVPHKNWRRLAARLDSYFEKEGIKPFQINQHD